MYSRAKLQWRTQKLCFFSIDDWFRIIIESVDSISRDERGFPLMQYITNGGITLGTLAHILNTTIVFYG